MLRCVLHTEGRRLELHPIWLKSVNQAQFPLSEADLHHQMVLALISSHGVRLNQDYIS